MSFRVTQKIYPGEKPRPITKVDLLSSDQLAVFHCDWGSSEGGNLLLGVFREFLGANGVDLEATSPFPRLTALSPHANSLRIASLLANDQIFHKSNGDRFTAGVEALILYQNGSELNWFRVGQPNLLLIRNNLITPLDIGYDLGFEFSQVDPLPSRLIGVDRPLEPDIKSFLLKEGDQLLALSISNVPQAIFEINFKGIDIENRERLIFESLVKHSPQTPFTLSLAEIF